MNLEGDKLIAYVIEVTAVLLASPFPGHEGLTRQLESSSVKKLFTSDDGAVVRLYFEVPEGEHSGVEKWVPVSAIGHDKDGVPIDYILHTGDDGRLEELQIARRDGEAIDRLPDKESLDIWT